MSTIGSIGNVANNVANTVGSVTPHVGTPAKPQPQPMSTPVNRASDPSRVFKAAPVGPSPMQNPSLNPSGRPLGSTNMPFDTKAQPLKPSTLPFNTKTQPLTPQPLAQSRSTTPMP